MLTLNVFEFPNWDEGAGGEKDKVIIYPSYPICILSLWRRKVKKGRIGYLVMHMIIRIYGQGGGGGMKMETTVLE